VSVSRFEMTRRQALIRLAAHYGQAKLAEYLLVSQPLVSAWINGKRRLHSDYWLKIDTMAEELDEPVITTLEEIAKNHAK